METHVKGDERILGYGDFVEKVLKAASEQMDRRYQLKSQGYTLEAAVEMAAELFNMKPEEVFATGKRPMRVQARSVAIYWAIRELAISSTEVGKGLSLSKSAVSRAAVQGLRLIEEKPCSAWSREVAPVRCGSIAR